MQTSSRCDKCDKVFTKTFNLNQHKRVIHKETILSSNTIKCPICDNFSQSTNTYFLHLKDAHNIDILKQEIKFSNEKG